MYNIHNFNIIIIFRRYLEKQRKKQKEEAGAKTEKNSDNSASFQPQSINQINLNNTDKEEIVTLEPEAKRRQILQATERKWKKEKDV